MNKPTYTLAGLEKLAACRRALGHAAIPSFTAPPTQDRYAAAADAAVLQYEADNTDEDGVVPSWTRADVLPDKGTRAIMLQTSQVAISLPLGSEHLVVQSGLHGGDLLWREVVREVVASGRQVRRRLKAYCKLAKTLRFDWCDGAVDTYGVRWITAALSIWTAVETLSGYDDISPAADVEARGEARILFDEFFELCGRV